MFVVFLVENFPLFFQGLGLIELLCSRRVGVGFALIFFFSLPTFFREKCSRRRKEGGGGGGLVEGGNERACVCAA